MKVFFGVYIALVAGVFVLWGFEPLHRAQEGSSVAAHTPSTSPAANTGTDASYPTTSKNTTSSIAPNTKPSVGSPPTTKESSTTVASSTAPIPSVASTSTSTPTSPEALLVMQIESGIHEKINLERKAAGLPALAHSVKLSALARAHSAYMLESGQFSHTDKEGCSSSCRMTKSGYVWSAAGENIYMMSGYAITVDKIVDMVVKGWMESPAHRENILNEMFTEQGIGIAFEGTKLYATEDFGTPR